MKYSELITVADGELYTIELQVTIDVTFGDNYFTFEYDSTDKTYINGREVDGDSFPFVPLPILKAFVEAYDFSNSKIWAQGRQEDI